jgi:hypothetical protein
MIMMALHSLYDKDKRRAMQEALKAGKILGKKAEPEPAMPGNRFREEKPAINETERYYFELALEGPDFTPLSINDKQLLRAVFFGNHASAEDALLKGANPDARDAHSAHSTIFGPNNPRIFGDTCLMMASKMGDLEMVRLLIRFKADVNLDFAYGSCPYPTALSYARRGGHKEIERELLAAGAR